MSLAPVWRMKPTFFPTPAAFRRWLRTHHRSRAELWVGFHKKSSGRRSITWPESVNEALCFGWIDGIRKKLDDNSYVIRFSSRRRGSNWSAVNTRQARALIRAGRMTSRGLEAFKARDPRRSKQASYERGTDPTLDRTLQARFEANRAAWRFFLSQPPGYRRMAIWFVMSAKLVATRARRLQTLIDDSAAGLRLTPLRRARMPRDLP